MAVTVPRYQRQVGTPDMTTAVFANPRPLQIGAEVTADAGNAAQNIGQQMAAAQVRVRNREDTIDRVNLISQAGRQYEDQLRAMADANKLTTTQGVREYEQFVTETKNALLSQHGGSLDSKAALQASLEQEANGYLAKAAERAFTAQKAQIADVFTRQLNTLSNAAYSDPAAIETSFAAIENAILDLGPAVTPEEEENFRRIARNELTASAISSLIDGGQYDEAEQILDTTIGLDGYLDPSTNRVLRGKIGAMRMAAAAAANKSEPLVKAIDPASGREIWVRQSQAAGMQVAPDSPLVSIGAQPQFGTIEKGWQMIQDPATGAWRQEPVPGGPADLEMKAQAAKAASSENVSTARGNAVVKAVDNIFGLLEDDGLIPDVGPRAGPIMGWVLGSQNQQIETQLNTVKANVGFDQLQAMRDSSPTGGALGQVSQQENVLLQSVLGSLSTSLPVDKFAEQMAQVGDVYSRVIYGSDAELELAVKQGNMTSGQAQVAADSRDAMASQFAQRAAKFKQGGDSGGIGPRSAVAAAPDEGFAALLDSVRSNPQTQIPPETLSTLSTQQLRELQATIQQGAVSAPAQATPDEPTMAEVRSFTQRHPDVADYAEKMAELLESDQAQTLEEAYNMAKAAAGGQ